MRSCDHSYKAAFVFPSSSRGRASESRGEGAEQRVFPSLLVMRVVIQRVKSSQVTVNGQVLGKVGGD